MPYSGEYPITSFFPRISSTGKRNENASHLVDNKRKRSSIAEGEANGRGPKKQRVQERQILCNTEQNGSGASEPTKPAVGGRHTTVSVNRTSSLNPPPMKNLSRNEPTVEDSATPKVHRPPPSSILSSQLSSANERISTSTSCIPFPRPNNLYQTGSSNCSNFSVPSSQSQDSGYESPLCDLKLSKASSSLPPWPPSLPLLPFVSFNTAQFEQPGDLVVESSQSQPILTFHVAPSRSHRHPSSASLSTSTSSEEIIPSSQSQETDFEHFLATDAGTKWKADRIHVNQKLHSPVVSPSTSARPTLTFSSDACFPIPAQSIHMDDQRESSEAFGAKSGGKSLPCEQNMDESETEDESEDGALDSTFAKGNGPKVLSKRAFIDDSSASVRSQTTQNPNDENSLPSVLTDFRDMFGDGDGSYPDDFPLSLR